jgi:hypothetical protein
MLGVVAVVAVVVAVVVTDIPFFSKIRLSDIIRAT